MRKPTVTVEELPEEYQPLHVRRTRVQLRAAIAGMRPLEELLEQAAAQGSYVEQRLAQLHAQGAPAEETEQLARWVRRRDELSARTAAASKAARLADEAAKAAETRRAEEIEERNVARMAKAVALGIRTDREDVRIAEGRPEHSALNELAQRTGLPGRPTSKHLVLEECKQRMRGGWKPDSHADAARVLSAWLTEAHPAAPRLKAGSIENILREKRRRKPKRSTR